MTTYSEPKWLPWARELQAMAQCGVTFTKDPYDRERYERLLALSAEIFHRHSDVSPEIIAGLFAGQVGYATPKVDVRGAVFDDEGRILLVRETADNGRWTLPGGWADVNLTAAENVVKEVREESGYQVRVTKLAAVWDRTRQGHPVGVFSCCKMFFTCEVEGGAPATGLETSEVRWFWQYELPAELSSERVMMKQIKRMFEHKEQPGLATDFD
ncbi:NUDIX hydrolase [Ochrobactrum sp. A-1]|uniref:NUDIX hydrolase n=1 Tax=Ochrobactrum sp. A-1 TaxID=2920940 RepID=UPI001F0A6661|nr:NUDIX hydrolase [Ochrobactrum sp. A-1]